MVWPAERLACHGSASGSNISKRAALAQRAFLLWKSQKTFLFVPVQKEKVVCTRSLVSVLDLDLELDLKPFALDLKLITAGAR